MKEFQAESLEKLIMELMEDFFVLCKTSGGTTGKKSKGISEENDKESLMKFVKKSLMKHIKIFQENFSKVYLEYFFSLDEFLMLFMKKWRIM